MPFPTIPTVAGGRVLFQLATSPAGTHTSPNLSSLTKNSGDLLLAIVIIYDGNSTNAEFSAWGGSFTELPTGGDNAGTATMGIGVAYKKSTGAETGTFTVTTADTSTNDSCFILLSIPNWYTATAPEAGGFATGTGAANPASFNPAGWDVEDTLWIAVGGSGETATTGSYTGLASAPTNYGNYADSGISADVVGGVEGAVAFRQLNAASEDVGAFTGDTSNARDAALVIAVLGALTIAPTFTADAVLRKTQSATFTANAVIKATITLDVAKSWNGWSGGGGVLGNPDIAYGNGYWVITSDGGGVIFYATDYTGTWSTNNPGSFNGVVYGNGYWVAVGASGALSYKATDPTGSWTSNAQGSSAFRSVAYGNDYWVAVGASGTLYYKATDPTGAWTSNAQGSTTFNDVYYANGYWVAVGDAGTLYYTATDPTGSWTSNAQGSENFQGLLFDDGYWVAVGGVGTVYYKAGDPTGSWTSNAQGSTDLRAVAHGSGYWVAVGNSGTTYYKAGTPTGSWTLNDLGASAFYSIEYANGSFVLAYFNIFDTTRIRASFSLLADAVLKREQTGSFTANAIILRTMAAPVVVDTFTRGNQSNFGTAEIGGTWTNDTRSSILSNKGRFTLTASTSANPQLPGIYGDLDAKAMLRASNVTDWDAEIRMRYHVGDDEWIRAGRSSGGNLFIQQKDGGSTTTIAGPSAITFSANTDYWFRFQAEGSAVRAKFWEDGTAEPGSWTISGTTTVLAAGLLVLDGFAATAVNLDWDNLYAGPNIFTADAVIAPAVSYSFTADAVLLKTQSSSFTANAVLKKTQSATFTANAVIKSTISGSLTANAVLKKTQSATFTADALIVREVLLDTFTRSVGSGLGTADDGTRYQQRTHPSVFGSVSVDGSAAVTSGSTIRDFIGYRAPQVGLVQLDFFVPADDADTGLSYELHIVSPEVAFFDQWLDIFPRPASGAHIWRVQTSNQFQNFTVEPSTWYRAKAWLGAPTIERYKIWKVGDPEPDWIESTSGSGLGTSQFTPSIWLYGSAANPAGLDNIHIWDAGGTTTTFGEVLADAVFFKTQSSSFTANAVLKATVSGSITANAVLKKEQTGSLTANAVIKKTQAASFAADAVIKRTQLRGLVYSDDFNRTVGSGIGTASDGTVYVNSGSSDLGSVNGSFYTVDGGDGDNATWRGLPYAEYGVAQFDFYILNSTAALFTFYDLEVGRSHFWVSNDGGGASDWYVNGGFGGTPVLLYFTAEDATWYTAKANFYPTGEYRLKVWKVGFPEPDWQASGTAGLDPTPVPAIYIQRSGWDASFDNASINSGLIADAVLKKTQSASFSADAYITAGMQTIEGSFTANAIVKREQTGSFTANAVILRTQAGSITADAVLVRTISGSITGDAVVKATIAGSFAANAVIFRMITGSLIADAILLKTQAGSITADAWFLRVQTGTVTADSVIKATIAGSFTANATIMPVFRADAILLRTQAGSLSADAVLMPVFRADAVIRETQVGSFTADAFIFGAGVGAFSLDAVLKATISGSVTANAVILRTQSGTITADAVLLRTQTGSLTADAVLLRLQTASVTADAIIIRTQAGSLAADAVLKATVAGSFTANAVVKATVSGSITADTVLKATNTGSITADAILKKTISGSFSADAFIQSVAGNSITANAVIQRLQTGSITADSYLIRTVSGTVQFDAVLLRTGSATFTANAVLFRTVQGSLTANAVLRQTQSASISADARILQGRTDGFNANAILLSLRTGALTANAVLRTTQSGSRTADAVLKRTQIGSVSADAEIVRTFGTISADAVLRGLNEFTLSANAVITILRAEHFSARLTVVHQAATLTVSHQASTLTVTHHAATLGWRPRQSSMTANAVIV
jgi:hypothetical protein